MEDLEYNYIKKQILTLTNVDLNCYKAPQMQRRLKAYLARSGLPNWPKFFRVIRADPAALDKFKDYLTINVSSFFRDPEKYNYLRQSILPEQTTKSTSTRSRTMQTIHTFVSTARPTAATTIISAIRSMPFRARPISPTPAWPTAQPTWQTR